MAREGQAEILAGLGGEGAGIKEESTREKAFSLRELAKAGELASHRDRARERRGQSASQGARGEEMEERREGEAASLRELRVS